MTTPVDFNKDTALKKLGDTVVSVLNANLGSFLKEPADVQLVSGMRCAPAELTKEYEGGVMIAATETKTGFEVGLIFNMADITSLADMMMMGDGTPKTELDDGVKDAIKELSNQFFGALIVPAEEQFGKKLQFRVDNVSKLENTNEFQSDNYIALDLSGKRPESFNFRMYVDEGFMSVLEPVPDNNSSFGSTDFFSSPLDKPSHNVGSGSPNMDMLLDIEIPVSVRMGSARLFLKDILGLGPGNIVELDQDADAPIDLSVNDKVIARGEVVIVDGYFGFRIKEIISRAERIKKLKD